MSTFKERIRDEVDSSPEFYGLLLMIGVAGVIVFIGVVVLMLIAKAIF